MSTDTLPGFAIDALRRRKARWESFEELRYLRITDDVQGHLKGTVLVAGRTIPGYPHIGRIYRLQQGLAQQFTGPFWAEEKVDGYNVRVVRVGRRAIALSHGGYVCPFTTDRLEDLLDLTLLRRQPGLILCAEIAGPENPYALGAPSYIKNDVRAFVFDVMRVGERGFVDQRQRMALTERHGLPTPQCYGRYSAGDWRALSDLMLDLDQQRREGVVFKAEAAGGRRTKYVTRNSDIYDIRVRGSDVVELPGDFFTARVLRMALFMDDTGIDADARMRERLGAALLDGIQGSIQGFKRDGRVSHVFRCRFKRRENAECFMRHMRHSLGHTHVRQRRLQHEEGYWLLEFDKEVPKLTGLLKQLFRGDALVD